MTGFVLQNVHNYKVDMYFAGLVGPITSLYASNNLSFTCWQQYEKVEAAREPAHVGKRGDKKLAF
mgnify:CR=1 FL=1